MHKKFNTEAEWHALRDSHIGGSEVAALFNLWRQPDGSEVVRHLYEAVGEHDICLGSLSPYLTGYRLFQIKSGVVQPDNLDEVERVMAGQFLEPGIAAWANKRWPDWGLKKSHVYHVHPTIEGMGASLDYFSAAREPIDIKNVDGLQFKRKWVIDDETGEIVDFPFAIVLQIQQQIACFGAQRGGVLANVGGNELRRGFMARHQPTIDRIEIAIQAFWAAVKLGLPPMDADYGTVAEVFSFGEAKDQSPPLDYRGDPIADSVLRRYVRWSAHQAFVKAQIDLLKGRLALHLGEHYKARFDSGQVSWPTIHREAKRIEYDVPEKTYRGAMTVSKPFVEKAPK